MLSIPYRSAEPLSADEFSEIEAGLSDVSEKLQKAVYSTYRASLKRRYRSVRSRAGVRKQQALTIVSSRYNLPVSTVKNIVRSEEYKNGTKHNHTRNYIKLMKFEKEKGTLIEGGLPTVCPSCENIPNPDKNPISVRVHPDSMFEESYTCFVSCFICFLHAEKKLNVSMLSFVNSFPDCFLPKE